jgi:hypothetical protein
MPWREASAGDAPVRNQQPSNAIAHSTLPVGDDTTPQLSRSVTGNAGSHRHRQLVTRPAAATDTSDPRPGNSAGHWRSLRARETGDDGEWPMPLRTDASHCPTGPGQDQTGARQHRAHSGSHAVFAADGTLFVGDAVLPTYTPNIGGSDTRTEKPLETYRSRCNVV